MNNTKLALALLLGISILFLGGIVLLSTSNRVLAEGMMRTDRGGDQNDGVSMMDVNDRNGMVGMMKAYHGQNWREECTNMMEKLNQSSS